MKFIFTNFIFSIILGLALVRLNTRKRFKSFELVLISFGLGPAVTVLLLYYAFLLLPHHGDGFYVALVLTFFFVIAIFGKNSFKILIDEISDLSKIVWTRFKNSINYRVEFIVVSSILTTALILYMYFFLSKICLRPLIGHDVLEYGTMGKILYEEKSLAPIWTANFSTNGYLYKILHAPSFSLFLTWEKILNQFFSKNGDFYFKSISTYYGLLILTIQYFFISKKSKYLGLISTIALLSGYGFLISLFAKHLDTYRILFYCVSLIYLNYSIENNDYLSLLLLGIFSGFAAFAHRIGVVLAAINCVSFIIFFKGEFKAKIGRTAIVVVLIFIFGGSHYIFDLFLGSGSWLNR